MMSVFSGERTKHTRSAPASSMRSTRNSLTALGRSTPCSSKVLATGSISFENASGWSREPAPAAGTMPRVMPETGPDGRLATVTPGKICHQKLGRRRRVPYTGWSAELLARRGLARVDQLPSAAVAGVLGQGPLARGGANPRQLRVAQVQRRFGLVCFVGHKDLLAGFKEVLYAWEGVGEHRRAAAGRLEQPARRGIAPYAHRLARDTQRQPVGGVEGRVLRRIQMRTNRHVRRPAHLVRVQRADHQEAFGRPAAGRLQEQSLE